MWLSAVIVAVIANVLSSVSATIAIGELPSLSLLLFPSHQTKKEFGCYDHMISDEWRQAVLDFHNRNRRMIAEGKQESKPGKMMPVAKDMNELYWDCNIEYNAFLRNCNGNIALPKGYGEVSASIKLANEHCNVTEKAFAALEQLWNEVTKKDLSADPNYDEAEQKNFGIMAFHDTTGFACTYSKCSDKLLCLYNKKPANNGDPLYDKGATGDECLSCQLTCVENLCTQDPYVPGEVVLFDY
ncbi:hypothetical protein Y032_0256g347 [Ancylostoma ceylanicum]|uniref:SCP domain-containing protein n=1 Tax=Ancylostoma ceylanicum TaxID=53326 RepID=A0A016SAZ8_9BILA|nr:hypothetical protein Y032_0256g347 [Ancylostoma ceylanicum]